MSNQNDADASFLLNNEASSVVLGDVPPSSISSSSAPAMHKTPSIPGAQQDQNQDHEPSRHSNPHLLQQHQQQRDGESATELEQQEEQLDDAAPTKSHHLLLGIYKQNTALSEEIEDQLSMRIFDHKLDVSYGFFYSLLLFLVPMILVFGKPLFFSLTTALSKKTANFDACGFLNSTTTTTTASVAENDDGGGGSGAIINTTMILPFPLIDCIRCNDQHAFATLPAVLPFTWTAFTTLTSRLWVSCFMLAWLFSRGWYERLFSVRLLSFGIVPWPSAGKVNKRQLFGDIFATFSLAAGSVFNIVYWRTFSPRASAEPVPLGRCLSHDIANAPFFNKSIFAYFNKSTLDALYQVEENNSAAEFLLWASLTLPFIFGPLLQIFRQRDPLSLLPTRAFGDPEGKFIKLLLEQQQRQPSTPMFIGRLNIRTAMWKAMCCRRGVREGITEFVELVLFLTPYYRRALRAKGVYVCGVPDFAIPTVPTSEEERICHVRSWLQQELGPDTSLDFELVPKEHYESPEYQRKLNWDMVYWTIVGLLSILLFFFFPVRADMQASQFLDTNVNV